MKKRVLDVAFVLATALLLLLCTVAWAPRFFGFSSYYVLTDSMKPAIPRGSMVFSKPIAYEEIRIGDVLVFENSTYQKNFVHRVLHLYEPNRWIFTKGDNNNTEDPLPTEYSYCKGIVRFYLPVVGFPAQFLHTTAGKVIVAAGYCLWAAVEVERLRTAKKKKEVCA